MMIERKALFPAFVDLLAHEQLAVRLGAMAAMEEMAQKAPDLAAQTVGPLWDRFSRADGPVKGDILYTLGEAGTREILPRLKRVLENETDGELKEAAREAMDRIHEKA